MRHACVSHAAGLVSTTVSGNHASAVQPNGRGIVDEADATLTLINSRVTGNSASAAPHAARGASRRRCRTLRVR